MIAHPYLFDLIPLQKIQRDPDQFRDTESDEDIDRLRTSIATFGLEQPLAVTELEGNRYQIIDGHRRYRCAQMLNLPSIACRVYPKLSKAERETRRFNIHIHCKRPKPLAHDEQLAQLDGYGMTTAYRREMVRLKTKLRQMEDFDVSNIIEAVVTKIQSKRIIRAKDLRILGWIFKRTANDRAISAFLAKPDMTIQELSELTNRDGLSGALAGAIKTLTHLREKPGAQIASNERAHLERLSNAISSALQTVDSHTESSESNLAKRSA